MDILTKFNELLFKKKKSFSDYKNLVLMNRTNELKLSDLSLEYGVELVKNYRKRLGTDYYIVLEEIFYAALDIQMYSLSDNALKILMKKFPSSGKINKMKGILQEATGQIDHKSTFYDELIATNILDNNARKRKIAILRITDAKEAVQELNSYLENNMCDSEAWLELADIYLEKQFLGGLQNLNNAKSYYSYVLSRNPNDCRALWGLYMTCRAISNLKKNEENNIELMELTALSIKALYEKKKNENLIKSIQF